jgi:hypothetical protein
MAEECVWADPELRCDIDDTLIVWEDHRTKSGRCPGPGG